MGKSIGPGNKLVMVADEIAINSQTFAHFQALVSHVCVGQPAQGGFVAPDFGWFLCLREAGNEGTTQQERHSHLPLGRRERSKRIKMAF